MMCGPIVKSTVKEGGDHHESQGFVPAQPHGVSVEAESAAPGIALRLVDVLSKAVLVAALLGELGGVLANMLARTFFHTSFSWIDDLGRLTLSTLAFIGGAVAYGRRAHTFLHVALNILPEGVRHVCLALADALVLVTAGITGVASLSFVKSSWIELMPALQIPAASIMLPLTASMVLIVIYAGNYLWREHRMKAWMVSGSLAVVILGAIATRPVWLPLFVGDTAIVTALALFFITILAGLPVGFALMLSAASYLWTTDVSPMVAVPHSMLSSTSSVILLALPFFIFAGLIMEQGGISLRIVRFLHALVGHLRGGLLQVAVIAMYIVSGLSGSKSADVAAVGTVMRDMLESKGYGADEGAAVLAASAIMGETVPPSIAMLILSSITQLSMVALFIAGFVPAAVISICLMVLIYFRALWAGTRRSPRVSFRPLLRATLVAVPSLLMPVILLVGILMGIATPTEVSACAVIYGLVLTVVVYREMGFRSFERTVIHSATLAGLVLFILAAASSFSWTLTVADVPQRLVDLLHGFRNSVTIFMVGSIALLIVAGCLLEGLAALNVLGPMLLPIAGKMGMSELHYGIVLIIAMGVGFFMPPAGVGFYVCCTVMGVDIERASRAFVSYLIIVIIGLLIVAFVPWFTLVVPNYFGFRG
jgi:tripartite ATP-independent transporter DctM subunit